MQRDFPFVRRNYDTMVAGTHLFIFLFVMTAIAYETQHRQTPGDRQLSRWPLFHGRDSDHHRVRRHHAYRDGGATALDPHDDRRDQPVFADGAGAVPAQEAAPQVLLMRAFRA